MKKLWVMGLVLLCVFALSLNIASAKKPSSKFSPVARLAHSGDIKGVVGCDVLGPDTEALIYIPGKSFVVKTMTQEVEGSRVAEFRFYNVPRGTYDLVIEIPGQDPVLVPDVAVQSKRITDVGVIPVACPPEPAL